MLKICIKMESGYLTAVLDVNTPETLEQGHKVGIFKTTLGVQNIYSLVRLGDLTVAVELI